MHLCDPPVVSIECAKYLIIGDYMAYDIFFLSYQESNADLNWERLKAIAPTAKRIDGIKGLRLAHAECAKRALTSHFFVVDADNMVTDAAVFQYRVPAYDADYVHLWYAENPVNGLKYGWGGLKLFPKKLFRGEQAQSIDMTTSFDLKIIPTVVSVTWFNASPYDAWRSAFREAAKLSSGLIRNSDSTENVERLAGWKTCFPFAKHGEWSVKGAQDGEAFAAANTDLQTINDWSWLADEFKTRYGDVS